jgi:hypothetical protein
VEPDCILLVAHPVLLIYGSMIVTAKRLSQTPAFRESDGVRRINRKFELQ